MTKLHIGCHYSRKEGYIAVDCDPEVKPDILADAESLPMFEDGSIDEAYCSHMLEHLRRDKIERTLIEWHRILKPGGILKIAVPDTIVLMGLYIGGIHLEFCHDHLFCNAHVGQYPWRWWYKMLEKTGFKNISRVDQFFREFLDSSHANIEGIPYSLNIQCEKE